MGRSASYWPLAGRADHKRECPTQRLAPRRYCPPYPRRRQRSENGAHRIEKSRLLHPAVLAGMRYNADCLRIDLRNARFLSIILVT